MNRLVGTKDAMNFTSWKQYDSVGNTILDTNSLGKSTTWAFDEKNQLVGQDDPMGHTRRWTYDSMGNSLDGHRCLGRDEPLRL